MTPDQLSPQSYSAALAKSYSAPRAEALNNLVDGGRLAIGAGPAVRAALDLPMPDWWVRMFTDHLLLGDSSPSR